MTDISLGSTAVQDDGYRRALIDPSTLLDQPHHDVPERHIIGGALFAPITVQPVGASAADATPGKSSAPAREDHVHAPGPGGDFRIFTDASALAGWAAPNGALAVTTDTNSLWQRASGVWVFRMRVGDNGSDLQTARGGTSDRIYHARQSPSAAWYDQPVILDGVAGGTGIGFVGNNVTKSARIVYSPGTNPPRLNLADDNGIVTVRDAPIMATEAVEGTQFASIQLGWISAMTQFKFQGGSNVLTTDGSGYANIVYPRRFQNGVLVFLAVLGMVQPWHLITHDSNFNQDYFQVRCYTNAGASVNNTGIRINWFALGW